MADPVGHKKHVKRSTQKDYSAILDHYRKNYVADLRIYNEEKSEIRSLEKKFKKELELAEREKRLEYELIGKHQRQMKLKKKQEEEERAEAAKLKIEDEQTRTEKMREKLRKDSMEIRELEAKINAAYMNKERASQVEQNEAARKAAMDEAEENRRFVDDQTAFAVRAKQEEKIARIEAARRLQADLENQLCEKEKNAQLAYEQFLKEKEQIDEIVERIRQEDENLRQDNRNKIENHRKFINCKSIDDEQRNKELQEWHADQDRKNREFEEEMQRRAQQIKTERQAKSDRLDRVQQHLRQELTMHQKEKDDYEKLIQDLALSEKEEAEQQKEKNQAMRAINTRMSMQKDQMEQRNHQQKRREAEQAEEDSLRQQMLAKFAEDDRIELMNAQKRRMKQLEHKKEAEALLAHRRQRIKDEQERRAAERAKDQRDAELMAQLIEEERSKLIAEHADNLLGFLPKGVIRNYDDLEALGEDYKEAYKPKDLNED